MAPPKSGLVDVKPRYDLVIVGCGLSGAVFAEQAAARFGMSSLIIDKRDHIGAQQLRRTASRVRASALTRCAGGNCFDFIEEHGIRISQYGVHLFHTQARVAACGGLPLQRLTRPRAEQARVGLREQVERVDGVRAPVRRARDR